MKSQIPNRGFSLGEIKAANYTPKAVMKAGLMFDKRRKSVKEENVEVLKKLLAEKKE